jgi:hypothetical protein
MEVRIIKNISREIFKGAIKPTKVKESKKKYNRKKGNSKGNSYEY